jgi:hypothetical protein
VPTIKEILALHGFEQFPALPMPRKNCADYVSFHRIVVRQRFFEVRHFIGGIDGK